jgi:hypothetical protein
MTMSNAERRLRRLSSSIPAPPPLARTYGERYEQVEKALVANTATETDIRWIYENVPECAPFMKTFLLTAAQAVLADPMPWRDFNHPDVLALKILTTPLGTPVPDNIHADLKRWADCLSFKPDENRKAFFTATRPFHIRAIFLLLALGSPDGMPLRRELALSMSPSAPQVEI